MRILTAVWLFFALSTTPATRAGESLYEESIQTERSSRWLGGPKRETPRAQWEFIQAQVAKEKLGRAIRQSERLVDTWPNDPLAVEAQRLIADLEFARENYEEAFDAYQALIDNFAGRFEYGEVLEKQRVTAHKLEHKTYKAFFGLSTYTQPKRAAPLYRQLLTNGPHMPEAPRILYTLGTIHLEADEFQQAIREFELLEQRYPRSPLAEEAALRRADAFAGMTKRNPTNIQPTEGELLALTHFLETYPESEKIPTVRLRRKEVYDRLAHNRFRQARFYEESLDRPDAAKVAYQSLLEQFPDSEWTVPARERILVLTDKER